MHISLTSHISSLKSQIRNPKSEIFNPGGTYNMLHRYLRWRPCKGHRDLPDCSSFERVHILAGCTPLEVPPHSDILASPAQGVP
jgi:hypothetical protein